MLELTNVDVELPIECNDWELLEKEGLIRKGRVNESSISVTLPPGWSLKKGDIKTKEDIRGISLKDKSSNWRSHSHFLVDEKGFHRAEVIYVYRVHFKEFKEILYSYISVYKDRYVPYILSPKEGNHIAHLLISLLTLAIKDLGLDGCSPIGNVHAVEVYSQFGLLIMGSFYYMDSEGEVIVKDEYDIHVIRTKESICNNQYMLRLFYELIGKVFPIVFNQALRTYPSGINQWEE